MKTDLIFGSIHLFCAGALLSIIIFYFLTNPSKPLIFYYFIFGLNLFYSFIFGLNLFYGIYRIYKVYIGLSL